ncbi:MAG: hypothetical protein GYB19_10200 [Rhodospirillales bacterium]|nr:hypothetical protein [Rhodospirillales bacterium]
MAGQPVLNARQRLKDDYEFYARNCLFIRTKSGNIDPLLLNVAQQYIHKKIEEQREKTGRVRALILKGRQQGCSTYVGGRYYWRVSHKRGAQAFILTHEQDATNNLFAMTERYHDNCPKHVKPSTGAANAKELKFDKLDSGYKVGTAGTKGVGRSSTIQFFHGSEVAFWPHAETHAAGVLQAIPDEEDTEVILESTANGMGNFFHTQWQEAEAGKSEFIAIFVPWFWQAEYRKAVPDDFTPSTEESEYREAHGLDLEQIVWRRAKIAELGDPTLFKQEYPATAAEAFQMTGHDSFIRPADVLRARKATCAESGPLVIGVDPARHGGDRYSIAWRRGRKVRKIENRSDVDLMTGAGWVKKIIDQDKPARVFIDVGGVGIDDYDLLVSWGYEDIVKAVNFGAPPIEPPDLDDRGEPLAGGPKNRRAEMWKRSNEALKDEAGFDIPDSDALQADACGPSYMYVGAQQQLLLQSKEDMRKKGIRSPDDWDAIALTFAETVIEDRRPVEEIPSYGVTSGGWMG